ncbi:unnamed protein product [Linum tenue]|uniref:Precursor of CEP9 n=1 Tax=Linum tenue TaxID=586396 RepID=A0AAV0L7I8_9ROSI|nr:unnamed protein product [Linum tenue]
MGKTLYQCSILLTLLACHGILLTTECRQLRSITNPPPPASPISDTSDDQDAGSKEDFRPTAPGVSPGVGHPENDFRPTAPGFSPGVGHEVGLQNRAAFGDETGELIATKIYNNDGFRPTTPGFSPGAGHAALTDDVDAFRPTKPGQSPGVGHAAELESSDVVDNKGYSVSGEAQDFKPTQPGHSPGVGHKN